MMRAVSPSGSEGSQGPTSPGFTPFGRSRHYAWSPPPGSKPFDTTEAAQSLSQSQSRAQSQSQAQRQQGRQPRPASTTDTSSQPPPRPAAKASPDKASSVLVRRNLSPSSGLDPFKHPPRSLVLSFASQGRQPYSFAVI